MIRTTLSLSLLLALGLAPAPRAQADSLDAIKKILVKVAEEMAEIDRLLRESSTSNAAARLAENVRHIQELLEQTRDTQTGVVEDIDKLLEELEKITNRGRPQQSQQQDQQQQDQQQRNTRRQTDTPDMVRQQRDQQRRDQERNDQEDPPTGENRPPAQRPESGTEEVNHTGAEGEWGTLPQYLLLLQKRGADIELPPKYLEFFKAYTQKYNRAKDR